MVTNGSLEAGAMLFDERADKRRNEILCFPGGQLTAFNLLDETRTRLREDPRAVRPRLGQARKSRAGDRLARGEDADDAGPRRRRGGFDGWLDRDKRERPSCAQRWISRSTETPPTPESKTPTGSFGVEGLFNVCGRLRQLRVGGHEAVLEHERDCGSDRDCASPHRFLPLEVTELAEVTDSHGATE